MSITTANSLHRVPVRSNKLIWLLSFLFLLYWIYGWYNCLVLDDWVIENLLVIICLGILIGTRQWHRLSDLSYLCIFCFVMLHVYGAFYAYTKNAFGSWLQNSFHLWRNPYDRIVHFSFGFFMAYPFREILIKKFRVSSRAAWLWPIQIAFTFGTIFEMIEWGVAAVTDSATGETYVATQGDPWDAHKDIALAVVGAAASMLIIYTIRRIRNANKEQL